MYAFLSYQTKDKKAAGEVRELLGEIGITCFLAHEDIQVSEEWRHKILEEIGKVDLFIALLSDNYSASAWCIQESGIAAFREGVTIIPLSLDGAIPPGFIGHIQSTKVEPGAITLANLLPGLGKKDVSFVIDVVTKIIEKSGSYRGAEADFVLILPFIGKASNDEIVRLLNVSASNGQVLHASKVAREFLPPIMARHGHLLDADVREKIEGVLERYAP